MWGKALFCSLLFLLPFLPNKQNTTKRDKCLCFPGKDCQNGMLPCILLGVRKVPKRHRELCHTAQVLADSTIVKKGCILGGMGLLPPACFSPRKSWLMPRETSLPDSSYSEQTAAWHSRRRWMGLASISGPLHVPLGWQALHGVLKLSSKEVAFFWGCSSLSSQCSNPTSASSSGPWIAPARSNLHPQQSQ